MLAVSLVAARSARAFGPTVCTPGDLPLYWEPTRSEGFRFALPRDQTHTAASIANNTYYYARIRANRKVGTVALHFRTTNLDVGDSVSFPLLNNTVTYAGVIQNGDFWTPAFASESSASLLPWTIPINITMDTVKAPAAFPNQFTIDTARVTCLQEAPGPWEMEAWVEKKNVGILTGSGDVLYYSYPAPPNNDLLGQPYHLHVALNYEGPAVDFDLYARCGAFPTASTFDYRGYSGSHQEFLDITMPCASRWYFAVDSYSGAGVFDLTIGEGGDEALCFAFTNEYTQPEKVTAADQIVRGLKAFYGATLGGILPDRVVFINAAANPNATTCVSRPGTPAKIVDGVITKQPGQSTGPNPPSGLPITFRNDFWANGGFNNVPYIVSHEMSHHYFGLPDEYPNGGDGCGHSLTGTPVGPNFIGYCTAANHTKDPMPGATYIDPAQADNSVIPYGNSVSMWDKIAYNHYGRPINFKPSPVSPRMKPVNTVENFSYGPFNFNTDGYHITTVYSF